MFDLILYIDESGSMISYSKYYINGMNKLISAIKEINSDIRVTIIKFNNQINFLCNDMKVKEIPKLIKEHYKPDGTTRLYDGLGEGLLYKRNCDNVLAIIMTDGEDNSSIH